MLIHCTMDELISIRGGDGSAGALAHLDDCEACRDELDRLHQRVAALRALRPPTPPRDRWPAIRLEWLAGRARQRRRLWGWTSAAIAASLAFGLGIAELAPRFWSGDQHEAEYATLLEEAQALEAMLRRIEPDTRVMDGRTAMVVHAVEDRLLFLDGRLAEANMSRMAREDLLWLLEQRVRFMDELVKLHTTKSTYVGF